MVLEGPIEEYEKVANLIGKHYRKKKIIEKEKIVEVNSSHKDENKTN